jgi:hypothetical protein
MPKHGFEIGHPSNIPNSTTMSTNTTSAADALGQNKTTNAIPQEVRLPFSYCPFHPANSNLEPLYPLLRRRHRQAVQPRRRHRADRAEDWGPVEQGGRDWEPV